MGKELIINLAKIKETKTIELERIKASEKGWLESQAGFEERKIREAESVEAKAARDIQAAKKVEQDRVGSTLGTKREPVRALEIGGVAKKKELAAEKEKLEFKTAQRAEYEANTRVKREVLARSRDEKMKAETLHRERLNDARQKSTQNSFCATFTTGEDKNVLTARSLESGTQRRDIQNHFDAVQKESLTRVQQIRSARYAMWQPKKPLRPEAAAAETSLRADSVAPRMGN